MKLGEIALFTGRVRELTDFYTRLFGVEPLSAGPGKAVFLLDGVHVLIHEGPSPPPHRGTLFDEHGYPPEGDHFAFAVEDVDETCSLLRSKGIEVEIGEFEWGRCAYLLDPDGRTIEIQGPDVVYGS